MGPPSRCTSRTGGTSWCELRKELRGKTAALREGGAEQLARADALQRELDSMLRRATQDAEALKFKYAHTWRGSLSVLEVRRLSDLLGDANMLEIELHDPSDLEQLRRSMGERNMRLTEDLDLGDGWGCNSRAEIVVGIFSSP